MKINIKDLKLVNNPAEGGQSSFKKFFSTRKCQADTLATAVRNHCDNILDKFNISYLRHGSYNLKKKYEHLKVNLAIDTQFDFDSEIKQVGDSFKSVKETIKPLAQVYYGEKFNKKETIQVYDGFYGIEEPERRIMVDKRDEKLICYCGSKVKCCHIMSIELMGTKQTTIDDNKTSMTRMKKKIERPKKSGIKGKEEFETNVLFLGEEEPFSLKIFLYLNERINRRLKNFHQMKNQVKRLNQLK